MTKKTMKVMNVSKYTLEIHNPRYIEFPPGQEVEVEYNLGQNLTRQPDISIVEEKEWLELKDAGKKKRKSKEK
jgi:hypothetical protein